MHWGPPYWGWGARGGVGRDGVGVFDQLSLGYLLLKGLFLFKPSVMFAGKAVAW